MDYQVANRIKQCFWNRDSDMAKNIVEENLAEIDFDDEDDVEKIIDLIISSFDNDADADFLEFLISKGFDINYKLVKKECLILKCADRYIKPEAFKKMADLGADIYSETSDGDNVLLRSSQRSEELAVYIAQNYDLAQLDKADKFGITPLMHAVIEDKTELAQALINNGSDVNMAGSGVIGGNGYWIKTGGLTPLALAIRHGNDKLVRIFLDAGANEMTTDDDGYPPVFSLVYYPFGFFNQRSFNHPIFDKKRTIIPLLKNLDAADSRGYTVLMESLCDINASYVRTEAYLNLPITLALIENGANVNAVANNGTTPLHLAAKASDEAVKALVKAGADINAKDNNGDTPLMIACRWSNEKKVRWLIKAGADFNIKNNAGESAVEIATNRGFNDALELMI